MGARAIVEYLNAHGYSLRGRRFHNSNVAELLQRPHYLGKFPGSKCDERGNLLPQEDWIWVACPQLVSQEQFDRAAALRAARSPRKTPPRVVNGPTLLTGVAKCGMPSCGAGMTIRTGKSGQYTYYTYSAASNRRPAAAARAGEHHACCCQKVRKDPSPAPD
jgi:hypothetical protein